MRVNLIVTPGCGPLILRRNDSRVLELARPIPVRRVLRRNRRPARGRCGCFVIRTHCCAICRAARSTFTPWASCTRRCCRWCRSWPSRSRSSRPSARIAISSPSFSSSSDPWAIGPRSSRRRSWTSPTSISTRACVGALGLALLLWTLLGTIKKVEDGFNFLWRVEEPRSFARRVTEYVALLIVGPIVVVSFIALSHNALETATAGIGRYMPFCRAAGRDRPRKLSPYFMVATIFTAVYMFVPNTKVKWKPALIGGVTAGILWAAVGQHVHRAGGRFHPSHRGVRESLPSSSPALLWTYFGWLILLIGAQLSFYVQTPQLPAHGSHRAAHVGRAARAAHAQDHVSRRPLVSRRQDALDDGRASRTISTCPASPSRASCMHSKTHTLLTLTDDEHMLPARDLGKISIQEIIDICAQ